MPFKILIFAFVIWHHSLNATKPLHRFITIKTNLLALGHIAIEAPFLRNTTAEFNYRQIQYSTYQYRQNFNKSGYHFKQNFRLNFKYHFPKVDELGKSYSPYLLVGVNLLVHHFNIRYNAKGDYEASRVNLGFGVKKKRYDVWVAAEYALYTTQNLYYDLSRAGPVIPEKWQPMLSISGGIAINIINL
jgi:hypothetical protein